MRRLSGDEQVTRVARSTIAKVGDDRLTDIDGKRHAIVALSLAANQDLARTPSNVLKPNRNHFRCAEAKPRHQQQHRMVAPPERIVSVNRFDQLPDRVRCHMGWQVGGTRGRLHALGAKRREIELLTQMRAARENIVAEIARLRVRRCLEDLKQEANTGPITRKIAELSADTITDVIRDRFTRETERLGLDRVTIAKTRARKGALLHQPKLVGARQSTTLARVFSEGERSALGLAAYFTEASLHALESALILDDPVTSLDHIHRERVANRLVDFAETRQVVVFTHDVAFVADLKDAATRKNVVVTERSVSRSRAGERLPGLCADTHPWKARDVQARIGELREDLDRLNKKSEEFDDRQYEDAVAGWAGKLSETWERIFSQEVVGQVLADGGLEVRPKMVRVLARFSSDDYLEFDGSYSRASRWARRHDKSALVNYVAPSLTDLENELELVDQWFKRVRRYQNT